MKRLTLTNIMAFLMVCLGLIFLWSVNAHSRLSAEGQSDNVITIGSAVTEIAFALDQGHRVVARDSTSQHPKLARDLPDVGYFRALSAEGVLSFAPQMIIASKGSGPAEVIEVLKSSGIKFIDAPVANDVDGAVLQILAVGDALGVPEKAAVLAEQLRKDVEAAQTPAKGTPKRVMFLLSAKGGKLMAAGQNTSADGIIRLAGGVNAVAGFDGYKILEDEAATAAAPDIILMMDRRGEHNAEADELFALPALSTTPAAQSGTVIRMEGPKLLNFGPRLGQAVRELHAAIYGG